ncbi:MAG: acyl-CoA dehydrogenase [Gammaproteobacteria bacterium]|jgi:alkylation response protein AidB-like acyl-CoA dehydrogenase|nr:acyl-CoA dehydrogenase [Chromatiales bacterium]MCP4926421.1 acyl-CoA dehydrogenase [Gammaproteobacteria bacterium]MDP7154009.1 acyl-CoA dehydrogenase [Gammaproteobacteria bacterium]MDP7418721.1 acyl-CoA dehydrogenase [Gammaproteobacteria bacterium]MDP7659616.1 acyl-CoA dehydrogenase [Gammaproteobacteria bacterium]
MADYQPPVKDMLFTITQLAGLDQVNRLHGFEDATPDLVEAVLDEAAQLANEVVAPINEIGDRQGARVEDGKVIVPDEFKAVYQQITADGWAGVSQPTDIGGQGLPYIVGLAVEEMWQAASLAWSLCALLTQGAARAIHEHGNDEIKALVLEKMISGDWTGTMNLTEPQAGSDLAAIRTVAVADGDGYRITGQKIFITWGDHEMADNVIHLVLARLPDAPPGVRGLTLFAVPKKLIQADGSVGQSNNVSVVSVEHKLGIHASPTCVMAYENAFGYPVGDINSGLKCMFTMMNHARLSVGLEGVAISERAYQQARAYARERIQGEKRGHEGGVAIIEHPDVRRMLMHMKANIEAMRGLAYVTGGHLDRAEYEPDEAVRASELARLELLVPVVKGWCTEMSQLLTSLALQVHGGMGYIEETGVAQYFRDARITTIYEGTTGIQAGDLIGRKILRDQGQALKLLIGDMQKTVVDLKRHGEQLATIRGALQTAVGELVTAAQWLSDNFAADPDTPGAVSVNFLMLMGTVAGGWQMARAALAAVEQLAAGAEDKSFFTAKIVTANYFAEQVLPLASAYRAGVEAGSGSIMGLSDDQF